MLSDKFGRKPVLVSMTLLAIFTSWPALSLLARMPDFAMMLSVLLWLSFIYGIYNGAMIPALTEIMPRSVRVAGFSWLTAWLPLCLAVLRRRCPLR